MEPLRPGQRLPPLLLIRDEEKKLVRAEGLGRVSRFHDDHGDHLPGHGNQSRCKLIGLPDRPIGACAPIVCPEVSVS